MNDELKVFQANEGDFLDEYEVCAACGDEFEWTDWATWEPEPGHPRLSSAVHDHCAVRNGFTVQHRPALKSEPA